METITNRLLFALGENNDEQVDSCLNEIAQREDAANILLDVFKDDAAYVDEFHMFVHLLDQLNPIRLYEAINQQIIMLSWRSRFWANFIINRVLNSAKTEACKIDRHEFVRYLRANSSKLVKLHVFKMAHSLHGEGKLNTDTLELVEEKLA